MSAPPSQPIPLYGGPPPKIPVYSRVDQLLKLGAGAVVSYFNMTSLIAYAATVTSVTRSQIVINSPNGGGSMTFPLTPMDGALALPIGILS